MKSCSKRICPKVRRPDNPGSHVSRYWLYFSIISCATKYQNRSANGFVKLRFADHTMLLTTKKVANHRKTQQV